MLAATITQPLLFEDDAVGPLEWRFDQPHASSDGGAILLRRVDRRLRSERAGRHRQEVSALTVT